MRPAAAIGTAVHNGWAVLVTVAVRDGRPVVVDRRRVELVPPGVPDQPYHHEGLMLPFPEADAVVRRAQAAILECARRAVAAYVEALSTTTDVRAITLPEPRDVPWDLADVLANRRVLYVADRHLYEVAVAEAATAIQLEIVRHERRGEVAFAAAAMQTPDDAIARYTSGLRATLGPPWRQDHQTAAAAAIGALARETRLALPATTDTRAERP